MDERINREAHPSLESLLLGLTREQLQSLLLKLSEQEPLFTEAIEREVALLKTSQSTTPVPKVAPKPQIPVDVRAGGKAGMTRMARPVLFSARWEQPGRKRY